jgi:hypothetical protein
LQESRTVITKTKTTRSKKHHPKDKSTEHEKVTESTPEAPAKQEEHFEIVEEIIELKEVETQTGHGDVNEVEIVQVPSESVEITTSTHTRQLSEKPSVVKESQISELREVLAAKERLIEDLTKQLQESRTVITTDTTQHTSELREVLAAKERLIEDLTKQLQESRAVITTDTTQHTSELREVLAAKERLIEDLTKQLQESRTVITKTKTTRSKKHHPKDKSTEHEKVTESTPEAPAKQEEHFEIVEEIIELKEVETQTGHGDVNEVEIVQVPSESVEITTSTHTRQLSEKPSVVKESQITELREVLAAKERLIEDLTKQLQESRTVITTDTTQHTSELREVLAAKERLIEDLTKQLQESRTVITTDTTQHTSELREVLAAKERLIEDLTKQLQESRTVITKTKTTRSKKHHPKDKSTEHEKVTESTPEAPAKQEEHFEIVEEIIELKEVETQTGHGDVNEVEIVQVPSESVEITTSTHTRQLSEKPSVVKESQITELREVLAAKESSLKT